MDMIFEYAIDNEPGPERQRQSQECEAAPIRCMMRGKPAEPASEVKKHQAAEQKKGRQSRNVAGDEAGRHFADKMAVARIEDAGC